MHLMTLATGGCNGDPHTLATCQGWYDPAMPGLHRLTNISVECTTPLGLPVGHGTWTLKHLWDLGELTSVAEFHAHLSPGCTFDNFCASIGPEQLKAEDALLATASCFGIPAYVATGTHLQSLLCTQQAQPGQRTCPA